MGQREVLTVHAFFRPVMNLPITCNCFEIAMVKTISAAVLLGYLALH